MVSELRYCGDDAVNATVDRSPYAAGLSGPSAKLVYTDIVTLAFAVSERPENGNV